MDIIGNIFKDNIDDVYDDDQVTLHSIKNRWEGNYWDRYEGLIEMVMALEISHLDSTTMLIEYGC